MSTVIICVGNLERGDDGVGLYIADLLRKRGRTKAKIIKAGVVPENFIGPVINARPERILFIDACLFNGNPGEFRLFDHSQLENLTPSNFSTHTPPLNLIAELLKSETDAEIWLLGIRPSEPHGGAELSPPVRAALNEIVSFIEAWTDTD